MPALEGVQGPGEITIFRGFSFSISSGIDIDRARQGSLEKLY